MSGLGRLTPAPVGVCALKTLKQLKWMWVPVVCVAVLSGCNDSTGGAAADAASSTTQTSAAGSETPSSKSATLSWDAPTTNTNGTALTDLAGYRIYYGSSAKELSQSVTINSVGMLTYVIDDLAPGTWYFAVMAVTSAGTESALSNVVEKTIG
jgi:Fibronectin type III domain